MGKPIVYIPIALMFLLVGCGLTPQGDALREVIAKTNEKVADTTLKTAEWGLCEKAEIGALKRKYTSQERADAYNAFCQSPTNTFVGPAAAPSRAPAPGSR